MKSHFSRFLHHIMSYLGGKPDTSSSLSYSDLIGVSRSNQVANLSNLDHRVKPDGDSVCTGRSMVEMLGVLAIIGVLSVGAIAGYSKAMFKYKLNKQTSQIGYILDYIIANIDQMRQLPFEMKNTLNKLGIVPDDMIKDNTEYAYDVFNSRIKLENHAADSSLGIALGVEINSGNNASEICRNFMTMAKARADDVSWVYVQKRESDESFSGSTRYYGNQAIGKNHYLRNMDMITMDNTCKTCAESNFCFVFILVGYDVN